MKVNRFLFIFVLVGAMLLASCNPALRIGALQTESKSVKLGDAKSVSVKINFGAGVLDVTGDGEDLLDADFTYNVAKLKPQVEYSDGTLTVTQPETSGMPAVQGVTDFRNEWGLRLSNDVPMELSVDVGAGTSNLKLSGLSLSGLDITLGATEGTIDLNGAWAHDLSVTIDAGASNISVLLPKDVGVRVVVDRGPTVIDTQGLTQDGDVYTNAAYGVSDVTLQIDLQAGFGIVNLLQID
ncbi:MAG TPA: toast rack family protein [Anaerolineales bacterium]